MIVKIIDLIITGLLRKLNGYYVFKTFAKGPSFFTIADQPGLHPGLRIKCNLPFKKNLTHLKNPSLVDTSH